MKSNFPNPDDEHRGTGTVWPTLLLATAIMAIGLVAIGLHWAPALILSGLVIYDLAVLAPKRRRP